MTTPGQQLTPGDDQNPPEYGVPEGAYVGDAGAPNAITDLNTLNEEEAKRRMQGTVAPAFNRQRDGVWQHGGLLSNLADLLFGIGEGSPAARLSDGMTDLNHRVDLMTDVSGYAGAWMSRNYRFGAGGTFKTIPFDRRYGPPKNADLNTSNHRMVLSEGSWSIHFTIVAGAGLPNPLQITVGHSIRVRVRNSPGSIMLDRPFDWGHIGNWEHAKHFAMPLIVPPESAPWSVEIGYRHNDTWWSLSGGTDKTLLWVERKNMDTDNSGIETGVPDGPDIT